MTGEKDLRLYWQWIDALITSMETCLHSDNPENVWKYSGYKQFARKYNELVSYIAERVQLPPIISTEVCTLRNL